MRAAEVLSGACDGELLDAAKLAEARQHAVECPHCAALQQLAQRIDELPAPAAPATLVSRLEALAVEEARRVRDAEEDRAALEVLAHAPATAAPAPRPWLPRVTAFASAAAVLLLAATAGGVAWINQGRGAVDQGAEEAYTTMQYDETAPSAVPESDAATGDTALRATELPAPPYVVFEEGVYVAADLPMPANVTWAGIITTDLGTGMSVSRDMLSAGPDGPLFVESAEGYQAFVRVERTVGRARYGLVAAYPISTYGTWPAFPEELPQPIDPDGTLAYSRFGFDDLGVDVYVPRGADAEDGFAVAPGTAPEDPAAGNPNWTWWVPLP